MCLLTSSSKSLIAEEKITVYKMVDLTNIPIGDISMDEYRGDYNQFYVRSPYQSYHMRKKDVIKNKLRFIPWYGDWLINEGFHSFTSLESAILKSNFWNNFIVRCIIPVSSEYVISCDGDTIVSSSIEFEGFELPESMLDVEKKKYIVANKEIVWGE